MDVGRFTVDGLRWTVYGRIVVANTPLETWIASKAGKGRPFGPFFDFRFPIT